MGEGFVNPFADLMAKTATPNSDPTRRLEELSRDGVAAELLFPNTVPPFFPSSNRVAQPPSGESTSFDGRA